MSLSVYGLWPMVEELRNNYLGNFILVMSAVWPNVKFRILFAKSRVEFF